MLRFGEEGIVVWDEIEARFRILIESSKMQRNYPIAGDIEIVGNKYEKNLE